MFLILDTETGGLDPDKNALLSLYMGVVDASGDIVAEREWYVLPGDRQVDAAALRVNGIDLDAHKAWASESGVVARDVHAFLHRFGSARKLTPMGWNLPFDLGFIGQLVPRNVWKQYTEYHTLDVLPVARFLLDLPRYNLQAVAAYLELDAGQAHTARADAILTYRVYEKLRKVYVNGCFA